MASRVGAAVGVDPEPDMLKLAAAAAPDRERGQRVVGSRLRFRPRHDLRGLGPGPIGAITAATAIHWMDHEALFTAARSILRPGGGVAVVTNGSPLWLQDTDWSRKLRTVLKEWTGRDVRSSCGTDEDSRRGNRAAMQTAGFTADHTSVHYEAHLDIEGIIGGLLSAMSQVDVADPIRRDRFADNVRTALAPHTEFIEHVRVDVQIGTMNT